MYSTVSTEESVIKKTKIFSGGVFIITRRCVWNFFSSSNLQSIDQPNLLFNQESSERFFFRISSSWYPCIHLSRVLFTIHENRLISRRPSEQVPSNSFLLESLCNISYLTNSLISVSLEFLRFLANMLPGKKNEVKRVAIGNGAGLAVAGVVEGWIGTWLYLFIMFDLLRNDKRFSSCCWRKR